MSAALSQSTSEDAASTAFEVSVFVRNTRSCTVRASGELDLATSDLLAATLEHQQRSGYRYIRVDLGAVSFIDATGLEVLVRAHHRLLRTRGTLIITGIGRPVARVLRITGLDRMLFTIRGTSDLPPAPDEARLDVRRAASPLGKAEQRLDPA